MLLIFLSNEQAFSNWSSGKNGGNITLQVTSVAWAKVKHSPSAQRSDQSPCS
jgi:hypothetical protein